MIILLTISSMAIGALLGMAGMIILIWLASKW